VRYYTGFKQGVYICRGPCCFQGSNWSGFTVHAMIGTWLQVIESGTNKQIMDTYTAFFQLLQVISVHRNHLFMVQLRGSQHTTIPLFPEPCFLHTVCASRFVIATSSSSADCHFRWSQAAMQEKVTERMRSTTPLKLESPATSGRAQLPMGVDVSGASTTLMARTTSMFANVRSQRVYVTASRSSCRLAVTGPIWL
jgi:hypothetical protein